MVKIEQLEMDRRHSAIIVDMKNMVEKYRAIFDWDVPEIDQSVADKMIVAAMHNALDDIEKKLLQ